MNNCKFILFFLTIELNVNSLESLKSFFEIPEGLRKTGSFEISRNRKLFRFGEVEFSSEFESGSLESVNQKKPYLFVIKVPSDKRKKKSIKKYKNWFFFKVSSKNLKRTITLQINNLRKNHSIFKNGIAPAFKSNLKTENVWKIYKKPIKFIYVKKSLKLVIKYRILPNESVFFALTFPYTTKKLVKFIDNYSLKISEFPDIYFGREVITVTPFGNKIEMITISSTEGISTTPFPAVNGLFPERGQGSFQTLQFPDKKCNLIISSRVHPSETGASYMLEGILNFIYENIEQENIKYMLKMCVVTIIPMLNPDGVELGNTRSDEFGINLNNNYEKSYSYMPSVQALKEVVSYIKDQGGDIFYADLHTHMTRRGFFVFGNTLKEKKNDMKNIFLPLVLKSIDSRLNFKNSYFGKGKKNAYTAKKYFGKVYKISKVYTFEGNYWGPPEKSSVGKTPVDSIKEDEKFDQKNKEKANDINVKDADSNKKEVFVLKDFKNFFKISDFRSFGSNFVDAFALLKFEGSIKNNLSWKDKLVDYFSSAINSLESRPNALN